MRLIDADALLERIKNDPLFPLVENYGISGVIKAEPTVEAIPVAWIEQYGEANWYDFGTQYNAITKMLEEWERLKRYETD